MVQIYAGYKGLVADLIKFGDIETKVDFLKFTAGFVRHQNLFDFEDIGSRRERADHKVKGALPIELKAARSLVDPEYTLEKLRLFLNIRQCKHVIFGGCHNRDYIPCLKPYEKKISHLSLLKANRVVHGFEALDFPRCKFPSIFRSNQLPLCRLRTSQPMKKHATMHNHSESSIEEGAHTISQDIAQDWKSIYHESIILNSKGQRLDPKIPKYDKEAAWSLGTRQRISRLCYNHLLAGCCRSPRCLLDHNPISSSEELCLRYFLRKKVCPNGMACRSFDCYLGHQCPYWVCYYGQGCQFFESHGASKEETMRIYRDNSTSLKTSFTVSAFGSSIPNENKSLSLEPEIDLSTCLGVSRTYGHNASGGHLPNMLSAPQDPPISNIVASKAPSTQSLGSAGETTVVQHRAPQTGPAKEPISLSGHAEGILIDFDA